MDLLDKLKVFILFFFTIFSKIQEETKVIKKNTKELMLGATIVSEKNEEKIM